MAKIELLSVPVVGELLRWTGAFAVRRGEADRDSIRVARWAVREGHMLAMFTEGTRQQLGYPGPMHPGAAMIAIQEDVPVVPCGLDTFRWSLANRRPCCVVWGEPMRLDLPRTGKGYKEGAALLGEEVTRLWRLAAPPSPTASRTSWRTAPRARSPARPGRDHPQGAGDLAGRGLGGRPARARLPAPADGGCRLSLRPCRAPAEVPTRARRPAGPAGSRRAPGGVRPRSISGTMEPKRERRRIRVRGVVQGVGFRPVRVRPCRRARAERLRPQRRRRRARRGRGPARGAGGVRSRAGGAGAGSRAGRLGRGGRVAPRGDGAFTIAPSAGRGGAR